MDILPKCRVRGRIPHATRHTDGETSMGNRYISAEDRFAAHTVTKNGPLGTPCLIWTGRKDKDGYGIFMVNAIRMRVHRWAYEHHNGIIDNDLLVCHRCDNPSCCNYIHLFLGTNADNIRDASRKGRMCSGNRHWQRLHPEKVRRGEHNVMAKLTTLDAISIRRDDRSYSAIATHYRISVSTVKRIKYNKTWRLPAGCERRWLV